ncbi:Phospholipase A1-Ialpha2, chloroplastic [Dichanthelium oligosanthes]|uniref:Phospholipase A1 EG1, chloroplastic/mitochondrial n=1 Tax=Dichanthelium oligosanthes TaxID=888268 RepID=A0A1E5UW47_9POAL|nr:Phospholipase A1-Ialpha2, chloroplastic [Dichanthelium oligosanthes]
MAAATKLAVAPGVPTTTTMRHRACAPLAVSSATPVTVGLSSAARKPEAAMGTAAVTAVVKKETVAPTTGGRAEAMLTPPLPCMWQEVQGADDWRGLVEPLHPLLRAEIVRYGELVAACYRAFDLDPRSKRYLNCKHGKKQMLQAVGMDGAGYAVTKYIYAAPDVSLPMGAGRSCSKSRWIGYVAVASDREAARLGRRDILVSFRGTVTGLEWLANFMSALAPARFDPADPRPDVRVESGFLSLYTSDYVFGKFTTGSCRNQLLSEISHLVAKHKDEDVSITLAGHSMGSSLALLLGYDLAELGLNSYPNAGGTIPITVFSFAGPRVGNLEFKNRCDELGVKVLRVVNVNDPVTKMPGVLFNESARVLAGRYQLPWSKACYAHVGVEVTLDFFEAGDIACVHDLQAYIDQLLKCTSDITVASDSIMEEEGMRRRVASMFKSWRWQMAAIRAGELIQALGI